MIRTCKSRQGLDPKFKAGFRAKVKAVGLHFVCCKFSYGILQNFGAGQRPKKLDRSDPNITAKFIKHIDRNDRKKFGGFANAEGPI